MEDREIQLILQASFCVQLGYADPSDVADAVGNLSSAEDRSLVEQLEIEGILTPDQRHEVEHLVSRARFAGRETVDLELPPVQLVPQDGQATLDFENSQVASAANKFGKPQSRQDAPDTTERLVRLIPGRYSIRRLHGRGGQARILMAFDEHMGREIAIKELMLESIPDETDPGSISAMKRNSKVNRFLREARVTAQLDHPNITPVHELGRLADGTLYYTMRFVRGLTLAQKIHESKTFTERLKLLGTFWDICNAITFAHDRGVVHRDIKPENVLVGEFGQTVLIDWGIAKIKGQTDERAKDIERKLELLKADEGTTLAGFAIGTPSYMSPEQACGWVDKIDERSDVWGLGTVLYEILTGKIPFTGTNGAEIIAKVVKEPLVPVRQHCPEAPAELAAVAEKALEKSQEDRYQTAGELAEEISAYMTGGRVRAYEYSSWELFKRFAAKNKAALATAGLIFAVIIASLVLVTWSYQEASRARDREHAERMVANFHLAQGYAEKADRLVDQGLYASGRLYAAASLVHNPANPRSQLFAEGFAKKHPASEDLLVSAASRIYRTDHSLKAQERMVYEATGTPNQVDISPDGNLLAAASFDGKLTIWETETGRMVRELSADRGRTFGVAFFPDGRRIATTGADGVIKVWDLTDFTVERELRGHDGEAMALVISPDATTLVSGGLDSTVRVWDVDRGECTAVLKGHSARIWTLAMSPGADLIASGSWDKTIRIWNLESGKPAHRPLHHDDAIYGLAFSPDGTQLASASWDKTVRVWDLETWKTRLSLKESRDALLNIDWSDDGRLLAAGGADRVFRIWDADSGEQLLGLEAHGDVVSAVRFLPGSRSLLTAGYDRRVRKWDLDATKRIPRLAGHQDWVYGVRYSPDGSRLVAVSWDKTVSLWDPRHGLRLRRYRGHPAGLYSAAFAPDGSSFATGDSKGNLRVWDPETSEPLHEVKAHAKWLYGLAYSPDGKNLVTSSRDGKAKIWDVKTGRLEQTIDGRGAWLYRVAYSRDGSQIAIGGTDNLIRLVQIPSGDVTHVLKGHTDWVSGLNYSHSGNRLVSSGRDGNIIIWDPDTGREIKRLIWHKMWVNEVRFSPDDKLLASASDDCTVVVWSLRDSRPLLELRFSSGMIGLDFSPDGKTLAVGAGHAIELYPLEFNALKSDPEKLLQQASEIIGQELDGFELKSRTR